MEPYVQLLAEHERYLSGYVYGMIPNSADAEDVLQDIKMALWREFEKFELGSNFGAWSRKVAFHRVMAFRKKKAIEGKRLIFSDACMEYLESQEVPTVGQVDGMSRRLSACIAKMKGVQRELIRLRYKEEFSIEEIAMKTGKTVAAAYRALSRSRLSLRECLNQGGRDEG
ncbi:sigma-70 family RNA polymerase sigma factor [Rubritalea tangerina]|uniref:Sigma-70 family RNA polymerase sigma factor n=2 Tax=Rubritalea tangerina TaxID=430798 RepID=A0ABW4ZF37_9BACT